MYDYNNTVASAEADDRENKWFKTMCLETDTVTVAFTFYDYESPANSLRGIQHAVKSHLKAVRDKLQRFHTQQGVRVSTIFTSTSL